MNEQRALRVGSEIQREIARMLSSGAIKDDRIGFVTITAAKVSPDLREAKVYFVTSGTEAEQAATAEGLKANAHRFRSSIGKNMRLRHAPSITFEYDISIENGMKIEALLADVRKKEGW